MGVRKRSRPVESRKITDADLENISGGRRSLTTGTAATTSDTSGSASTSTSSSSQVTGGASASGVATTSDRRGIRSAAVRARR
ncbi:hypothetical protein ACQUW5_10475 [Legionella sp. CNM-1927-20]|uniref:hypothetical protein n=1 Tax=Legionella sp. CNM-1927-20 TaxID=3422221 RepID=UPI00403A9AFB